MKKKSCDNQATSREQRHGGLEAGGGADIPRRRMCLPQISALALAVFALSAILFAIPADETRADDDNSATRHSATDPPHNAAQEGNLDANKCASAGWALSAEGGCGILVTLAGGAAADQCHLSGSASPQCADVFGSIMHFPAPVTSSIGATLHFVYNCDPDGDRGGMIPARANTIAATECGCESKSSHPRPGACVPEEEDSPNFDGIAEEALCGAFGGMTRIATSGGRVCSGMDANDTFCILDAEEADGVRAFPCRGLFKHLRICNLKFNRKALNPFFCGAPCSGEDESAVGKSCVAGFLAAKCGRLDLFEAASLNDARCAKFLINQGAKIDDTYQFGRAGRTPLHLAAEHNAAAVAALLIERGGDVDMRDSRDNTPLHLAAASNAAAAAAVLIAGGADVDARDIFDGYTPLHLAADRNAVAVAALLIEHGADINATNKSFWTPLDHALNLNYDELAALFREHGGECRRRCPRH